MKAVKQEDLSGCSVACVAALLNISYQEGLSLFKGARKAKEAGFYCKEIVIVLENRSLKYEYKYLKTRFRKKIYNSGTIVFLRTSKKYPIGHYLLRVNGK